MCNCCCKCCEKPARLVVVGQKYQYRNAVNPANEGVIVEVLKDLLNGWVIIDKVLETAGGSHINYMRKDRLYNI